jgi:hypothetical protein
MLVTISDAAKMVNVSRATIYNDIESGTLSVEIGAKGRKMVDISELSRVYKTLKVPDETDTSKSVKTEDKRQSEPSPQSDKVAVLQERVEAQRKQAELLEEMLKREQEERKRERETAKEFEEYFKTQIENQAESIKNFTRLLEDQRGDKPDNSDIWQKSLKALEDRIANQEAAVQEKIALEAEKTAKEAKEKEELKAQLEEKEKILAEKEEALALEKKKSFVHKLLGR